MVTEFPSVIKLKDSDPNFVSEVIKAGGKKVNSCFGCGTCVAGCPTVEAMDHPPRKLIRMINLGMRDQVLNADTIWLCASCNTCVTRCPRGVQIPNVMAAVKSIAIKEGIKPSMAIGPIFYQSFMDSVKLWGRVFEAELMGRIAVRTKGFGIGAVKELLNEAPLGKELFMKGKLAILPHKWSKGGISDVKRIVKNIEKMEEGQ